MMKKGLQAVSITSENTLWDKKRVGIEGEIHTFSMVTSFIHYLLPMEYSHGDWLYGREGSAWSESVNGRNGSKARCR